MTRRDILKLCCVAAGFVGSGVTYGMGHACAIIPARPRQTIVYVNRAARKPSSKKYRKGSFENPYDTVTEAVESYYEDAPMEIRVAHKHKGVYK